MPKYRDYFRRMMAENEQKFADFAEIHAKYEKDKAKWQDEYNSQGAEIVEIVREWEGKLCGHSEKGEYAKFSSKLADKFWGEVKAFFPLIDFVGVEIEREPQFVIKGQIEETIVEEEPVETDKDILEIEKFEVLSDEDEFVVTRLK